VLMKLCAKFEVFSFTLHGFEDVLPSLLFPVTLTASLAPYYSCKLLAGPGEARPQKYTGSNWRRKKTDYRL